MRQLTSFKRNHPATKLPKFLFIYLFMTMKNIMLSEDKT